MNLSPSRLLLCLLLLLLALPAAADEWNDSFSTPRRYRVLRDIAVRDGPGNSHRRLGSVARDDVVRVHQIVNGWHQFMYDGQKGWVFKRYLRPMAAGEGDSARQSADTPEATPKQDDAVKEALQDLKRQPEPPDQEEQAPLAHLIFDKDAEPGPDPAQKSDSPDPAQAANESAPASETTPSAQASPEAASEPTPEPASEPTSEPASEAAFGPEALPEEEMPPQEEPSAPREEAGADEQVAAATPEPEPEKPRAPLRKLGKADIAACERFISLQPGLKSGQASFQGTLKPGQNACFRILALDGWTLEVTLDSSKDSARFDVFTPTQGRMVATMKAWAHPVARSGDKQIVVYSNEATRYTLGIQLR